MAVIKRSALILFTTMFGAISASGESLICSSETADNLASALACKSSFNFNACAGLAVVAGGAAVAGSTAYYRKHYKNDQFIEKLRLKGVPTSDSAKKLASLIAAEGYQQGDDIVVRSVNSGRVYRGKLFGFSNNRLQIELPDGSMQYVSDGAHDVAVKGSLPRVVFSQYTMNGVTAKRGDIVKVVSSSSGKTYVGTFWSVVNGRVHMIVDGSMATISEGEHAMTVLRAETVAAQNARSAAITDFIKKAKAGFAKAAGTGSRRAVLIGAAGAASMGLGVAALFAEDAFTGKVGCAVPGDSYMNIRPPNCSKPIYEVDDRVLAFLDLPPEEQTKIFNEMPGVCEYYSNLLSKVSEIKLPDNKNYSCTSNGGFSLSANYGDRRVEQKVTFSGASAKKIEFSVRPIRRASSGVLVDKYIVEYNDKGDFVRAKRIDKYGTERVLTERELAGDSPIAREQGFARELVNIYPSVRQTAHEGQIHCLAKEYESQYGKSIQGTSTSSVR
jgi:hypothetical protein